MTTKELETLIDERSKKQIEEAKASILSEMGGVANVSDEKKFDEAVEKAVGKVLEDNKKSLNENAEMLLNFEKAKLVDFTYHCYKTGMLNAVSVGFIANLAEPNTATGGFIVKDWELLEFSAVAVPANQDAIAQAVKSFGESGNDIVDPIERIKVLEGQIAECHKTMKEQAEKLEKAKSDLDGIELEDEKEITFEDEEINLDEIN